MWANRLTAARAARTGADQRHRWYDRYMHWISLARSERAIFHFAMDAS